MERAMKATAPPEPATTPTPPPPPPKPSEKSNSLLPSQANLSRSYADVIKLAAEKKLPVYFYQDIDKKKIGKGLYVGCRIVMKGKHKTSKRAIFIDCVI
jgi:hypothetical protein